MKFNGLAKLPQPVAYLPSEGFGWVRSVVRINDALRSAAWNGRAPMSMPLPARAVPAAVRGKTDKSDAEQRQGSGFGYGGRIARFAGFA